MLCNIKAKKTASNVGLLRLFLGCGWGISFLFLSPIRLVVGVAGIDNGVGAWIGFPVCFALQAQFHSVSCQYLFFCIIVPGFPFPASVCNGMVGPRVM